MRNNGTYVFEKTTAPYAITIYAKNLSSTTANSITYQAWIDDTKREATKGTLKPNESFGIRVAELPLDNTQHTVKLQLVSAGTEANPSNNTLKFTYLIKK